MSNYKLLKKYYQEIIIALFFVLGLGSYILNNNWLPGLILCSLVLIYFFSYHLELGLYLMVLFYPFIDWQIYLTDTLNLPPVDLIAIIVFLAFIVNVIRNKKISSLHWPFLVFYSLFIIVSAISIFNSYFFDLNIRYLFRPLIFVYLIYIFLPDNIIKSFKNLINIFWLFFGLGIIGSLMGLSSIVVNYFEGGGILRAMPLTFGSWQPLGANQNLLAELLITALPLSLFLAYYYRKNKDLFYYLTVGWLLMVVISLLTFSRAAWLSLIGQLLVLLFFILPQVFSKSLFKQKIRSLLANNFWVLVILILILIVSMGLFLQSNVILSSDANRLFQWKIGLEMFKLNPLWGAGIGSFIQVLNHDPYYAFEFGSALDAHGLVLKLLSELGLFGLLTFFIFILAILVKSMKVYQNLKQHPATLWFFGSLMLSAFSIVFFQLFNTSYYTAKMWLPLGLLVAALKLYEPAKKPVKN
jgi:O-antigen ligase